MNWYVAMVEKTTEKYYNENPSFSLHGVYPFLANGFNHFFQDANMKILQVCSAVRERESCVENDWCLSLKLPDAYVIIVAIVHQVLIKCIIVSWIKNVQSKSVVVERINVVHGLRGEKRRG